MCIRPKKQRFIGTYKDDNYKAEKGTEYDIETFTKCGYCSQCIAEKANNWVIRNYYEQRAHKDICFITLTYDNAHRTFFLIKKDFQDFMKRLRKKIKVKIRAFLCGEYGERKNREHGHIIIYGWKDDNAIYKGLSKKNYMIFQSKIIQETWGKGITTYQNFANKEIPYISLYETAKDVQSKAYKTTTNSAKKLIKKYNESKFFDLRKTMLNQLEKMIKKAEKEKKKYIQVKEFNTWSKALGWKEFFKEFKRNSENYDFKEYIEDKEFYTPTPWVKKLANKGYKSAIAEMLRREAELKSNLTEEELTSKNLQRAIKQRKSEILDYADDGKRNDL